MTGTRLGGRVAALAAIALALGSLVPWANVIPGGHSAATWAAVREAWLYGTLVCLGFGLAGAIVTRRLGLPVLPAQLARFAATPRRPALAVATLALGAFGLYVVIATVVFDRRPLLIDEIIQVFQARIFASGRLWLPASGEPAFFGAMHLVEDGGRLYGQFPPGGPALLAIGTLAGAEWLVVPVAAALSVALYAALLPALEPRPGVRNAAVLLFAFAPFAAFMSGSHMNHVTALLFLLAAFVGLSRLGGRERPSLAWSGAAGLGFGCAAAIRPVDAFAFAAPAAVWLFARGVPMRRRWLEAAALLGGAALPIGVMMAVNAATTGAPLRFGYDVLWGPPHGLGFHPAPWGPDHTPARGAELVNLYLLRMNTYLYETPFPALLLGIGTLLVHRRWEALETVMSSGAVIMVGFYFAYWHDGFFLGPRFLYPTLPLLSLWTARCPALVRERWGDGLAWRTLVYGLVVGGVLALTTGVPVRWKQYASGMLTMRWDADRAASEAGVRNALVLVRESWGSQLSVRLWRLGLSRADAERLYANVDACRLELAIRAVESVELHGAAARQALWPLLADSAATRPTDLSPDRSERFQPGVPYSGRCMHRLQEDRSGFTLYAPLLLARGGNAYARDLHELNNVVLERYPDRPVFLLRPAAATVGLAPRFYPISRDSLARVISPAVARGRD